MGEPLKIDVLGTAAQYVNGPRSKDYGSAKDNMQRIADLWSSILGVHVAWQDVVKCMVAVKLARLCNSPDHFDSWVDVAGYAEVWAKAMRDE